MKYNVDELAVISEEYKGFFFEIGDRVTIERIFTSDAYVVTGDKTTSAIVLEKDLRKHDAIDEYDDMYCDTCGGTSCLC